MSEDAGTLEMRIQGAISVWDWRISRKGVEIGAVVCGAERDLLRDALAELRRLRVSRREVEERWQRFCGEARASSPDLRALVLTFMGREEAHARAAQNLENPWDDRSISAAVAEAWKLAKRELEASLTGTGERDDAARAVSQATHGANAPTLAPDGPVRADR